MTVDEPRRLVSTLGERILADGLTKRTGGNISVRTGDETVVISPSGMSYKEIEPEDIPILDVNGERVAGDRKSSSKFRTHMDVPRQREDAGVVVHDHSPYASTFTSIDEPAGPSHYLIVFIGDEIPVASCETYGTAELTDAAMEALGDDYNARLLKKRGVLATGVTAEGVYEVVPMVGYYARIHHQTRNVGEPSLLLDEEIDTLPNRFADCGQVQLTDKDGPNPTGDCVSADRLSDLTSHRSTVSRFGRKILHQGLVEGIGRNTSVQADDLITISPSGILYGETESEGVSIVTLDDKLVAGDHKPSSKVRMHTGILCERGDTGIVVHNHSLYASTFANLSEPVPASYYLIALVGDEIPVAGYETYGMQGLADLTLGTPGDDCNACLLENCGVAAVGDSIVEAHEVALMVGYCARIHHQALSTGEPSLLPDKEISTPLDHFAGYGQDH